MTTTKATNFEARVASVRALLNSGVITKDEATSKLLELAVTHDEQEFLAALLAAYCQYVDLLFGS